jgi:hypothetical protein
MLFEAFSLPAQKLESQKLTVVSLFEAFSFPFLSYPITEIFDVAVAVETLTWCKSNRMLCPESKGDEKVWMWGVCTVYFLGFLYLMWCGLQEMIGLQDGAQVGISRRWEGTKD